MFTHTNKIYVFVSESEHLLVTDWALQINPRRQPATHRLLSDCYQSCLHLFSIKDCEFNMLMHTYYTHCSEIFLSFLISPSRRNVFIVFICLLLPEKVGYSRFISCFLFMFHPSLSLWDAGCGVTFHDSTSASNKCVSSIFCWVFKCDKSCMSSSLIMPLFVIFAFVSLLCVFVLTQSDLSLLLDQKHSLLWQPTPLSSMYVHKHMQKTIRGEGHRSLRLNGHWSALTNRKWG